jgi:hypothetical protein
MTRADAERARQFIDAGHVRAALCEDVDLREHLWHR